MIESKFNTPSKFTGEMMGTKVAVEYNHSTIDFDEVIDAFNTIMTGLGYHPDAIKEWIVDRAAEYNEGDNQSEDLSDWDVTLEDGLEDDGPWPLNGDPIQNIIDILKGMEIDGEMMQYIIEQVGMDEQMAIQLATKFPKTVVDHIYEMEMEAPKYDGAGYTKADRNPPYVSDDFQIGPNGAYEHNDEEYIDSIVAAIKANQIKKKKYSDYPENECWTKYKIVVPTEEDRQELMKGFEHIHYSDVDAENIVVNQLIHEYLDEEQMEGAKNNIIVDSVLYNKLTNNLIGKTLNLDLGSSSPVNVTIKEITDTKVIVDYKNSTPGRFEEFSIDDFEYFSGLKIK